MRLATRRDLPNGSDHIVISPGFSQFFLGFFVQLEGNASFRNGWTLPPVARSWLA